MNFEQKLDQLKIVIVSHIFATGPAQELESYLKSRAETLVFIGHPFSYCNEICSFLRIYERSKQTKEKKAFGWRLPGVFFYSKDFFYTFFWVLACRKKFDLYIGADNLNAFTGIILRLFGCVETVVFYTVDYIPERFDNRILNWLYHWADRFCVRHSDWVWNLSPRMVSAREKYGVSPQHRDKQLTVPMGTHRVNNLDFDQINRYEIAFMGHLREGQGLDFMIAALPEVLKKVPMARLLVIGTGPIEQELKTQVNSLGLGETVEFLGFVEDHNEVQDRLARSAVAIAPYADSEKTFTRYADPGKPKVYLAAGLPVIITKVPEIAYEVEKQKAGIAINYSQSELVDALVLLLTDDRLLKQLKENAIELACRYSWEKIFSEALQQYLNGEKS